MVIFAMVWILSGCGSMFALTNAQAYSIKKYADDPEKFGYKCPWDNTDRRHTYNTNHTSTKRVVVEAKKDSVNTKKSKTPSYAPGWEQDYYNGFK